MRSRRNHYRHYRQGNVRMSRGPKVPQTSEVLASLGIDDLTAMMMIRGNGIPATSKLFTGDKPSFELLQLVLGNAREYDRLGYIAENAAKLIRDFYALDGMFNQGAFFGLSTFHDYIEQGLVVAGYFEPRISSRNSAYSDKSIRSFVGFQQRRLYSL